MFPKKVYSFRKYKKETFDVIELLYYFILSGIKKTLTLLKTTQIDFQKNDSIPSLV